MCIKFIVENNFQHFDDISWLGGSVEKPGSNLITISVYS